MEEMLKERRVGARGLGCSRANRAPVVLIIMLLPILAAAARRKALGKSAEKVLSHHGEETGNQHAVGDADLAAPRGGCPTPASLRDGERCPSRPQTT